MAIKPLIYPALLDMLQILQSLVTICDPYLLGNDL